MSNYLDLVIHDFENICRVCLAREDLKPLYDKCPQSTCLGDMLLACTFVKFAEDDGLPKKICINCIHELNQAFSFAKRCETTDKILRDCLITQLDTELANNLPQSQKLEAKQEMITEIRPAIILPHINRAVKDVLKDCKYVEDVKEKGIVVTEEENDNINDDFVDESYIEDYTIFEEFDNFGPRFNCTPTNSQIKEKEESWKDKDGFHLAERTDKNLNKIKPECKRCFVKLWDCKDIKELREKIKYPPNIASQDSSASHDQHTGHSKPNHRMYQYQTSGKLFKNLVLKAHQTIHTAKNKAKLPNETLSRYFHCIICDQTFSTKILLRRHSLIHGLNNFLCSVCGNSFVSKYRLGSHLEKVHKEVDPFTCYVCGKAFRKRKFLKRHKLIHTHGKSEVCSICSEVCTQKSILRHIRLHTGEKPYSCEVCGKSFVFNGDLTRHKSTHASDKLHVCTICNKPVSHLKRHMRKHPVMKSYSCEVCGKSFSKNLELTVHKRIHTGKKPCICSVCGKEFSTSSNMLRHKRRHENKI